MPCNAPPRRHCGRRRIDAHDELPKKMLVMMLLESPPQKAALEAALAAPTGAPGKFMQVYTCDAKAGGPGLSTSLRSLLRRIVCVICGILLHHTYTHMNVTFLLFVYVSVCVVCSCIGRQGPGLFTAFLHGQKACRVEYNIGEKDIASVDGSQASICAQNGSTWKRHTSILIL